MTIAILATGDEIVHGDTLNTNAYHIAQALCSEGLPLGLHVACSDKENEIIESLNFLSQQHDILIVIGGLGPTKDDITRFALSQFVREPLIQHQIALEHVQARVLKGKMELNEGNLQQCLFPAHAHLFPNPNGTALGCSYEWKGKTLILLPGPPRECLPMFNNYALPLLLNTQHSDKQIIKWRIFGLAESEIGETLEKALQGLDCKTGYRLEVPYIEFKVRCKTELIDKVKSIIDPILAPHIISSVEKKASEQLKELIQQINDPITIVDETTGGLLQTLLITPDTYPLINFHGLNRTKLFFHITGLEEYWLNQPSEGTSQIAIHYSSQTQKGREIQQIPYRSPLVVYYAAEWLSFRLFHLINQLHQVVT
ncbi:competence/damage-inducible protein A [Legionella waltersii]|uniref:Competence damage inducible protein CinA n=1 Tax=Legionella waltersii TaxID=66969 RepID=A0A0W1ACZ2_9GAMM|nr:competence/damage-inducible protein A [Legionella waltersii]KTD79244.1 competence damage inducible protein CinA [Legionella waltersii]SNV12694.1 Competence damage inducible protein CinA [Legionella waltersii]